MAAYDFILQNTVAVTPEGVVKRDIGVLEGRISAIEAKLQNDSCPVIDAAGLTVMPGGVDVHVHFNEPGMGHWEGFETGSAALAAGGTTTYFDMPLNGRPPTVTASAFEQKLDTALGKSAVDYALWGGLMPGYVDRLGELAESGVIGFKAFMSSPGMPLEDDFRESDEAVLLEGMREVARLGSILALHAEDNELVARLSTIAQAAGYTDAYSYTASRPIAAEVLAVERALSLAEQTGCKLHFVHVSSAVALSKITEARHRGMDVSAEVCTHQLMLTADDLARLGPVAKCAPPLRTGSNMEALWAALIRGEVDMIASDHSPCETLMKEGDDFFAAWGGISGAQHRIELMIDEGHLKRGIPLTLMAELLAGKPAERFGLGGLKGRLEVGMDADFVLIDLKQSYKIETEDLLYLHPHSPFVGREVGCKVMATFCRGQLVYSADQGVLVNRIGKFLKATGDSRRARTRKVER
ncbi:allantoinase AllB [Paenibacillus sp. OV219]|uniref:allantoinase AllB n=1 Tax=Paenibacillus sp. OV219 TaxID=1884377 RepID=UPI0008B16287|nr:allantoinase AllB [Paenibacillus sp. OV219]SEN29082.1 allantoinase [Paenibacillus sp. OV219]